VEFECGEAHLFSDHVHPDIECNKTTGVCSQDLCCTQRTCSNSGASGDASHMSDTGPYDCSRFDGPIQNILIADGVCHGGYCTRDICCTPFTCANAGSVIHLGNVSQYALPYQECGTYLLTLKPEEIPCNVFELSVTGSKSMMKTRQQCDRGTCCHFDTTKEVLCPGEKNHCPAGDLSNYPDTLTVQT